MILLLEVLPTLIRSIWNLQLSALLRALTISALFHNLIFPHQSILLLALLTNAELVPSRQSRAIQIGFIGVCVAIEGRVDGPFHQAQGCVEARG